MVPPPTRKISCRLTVTYAGFTDESILLRGVVQARPAAARDRARPARRRRDVDVLARTSRWHRGRPRLARRDAAIASPEPVSAHDRESLRLDARAASSTWTRGTPAWIRKRALCSPTDRCRFGSASTPASSTTSTAVVACSWDDARKKVVLAAHRTFQPTAAEPIDFETMIEATVRDFARRFHVMEVRFDPWQMQGTAQRLAREGIKIEEFPQSVPNITAASQNLYELIQGHNIVAYPDAAMRLAVSRAVALETPRGWKITKEKSSHKVDVVVALAHGRARCGAGPNFDSC